MPRPRLAILSVPVVAAVGCAGAPPAAAPSTQPTAADLARQPVTGALGLPLGTVAEVRATVVAGRELRAKAYDGRYLLSVTEVDGRPLATPALLEFSVPGFASVRLANESFGLHELKTGRKARSLDGTKVAELEKDYVGRQVRLLVYETGAYSGIPRNLPDDVPTWADRGFGFYTWLQVLAERP